MMEIILLFAFIVLLVFTYRFFKKPTKRVQEIEPVEDFLEQPYFKKSKLMTQSELSFFLLLEKHLPDKYIIFTKVRIEDFIGVKKGHPHLAHFRGYIKSRHVDFLICERFNHMRPYLAIEVDGSSHQSKAARDIDERKNKICQSVGLRLERVKVGDDFESVINSTFKS